MTFLRSLARHAIHDAGILRSRVTRRLATAAVSGLERATELVAARAGVPATLTEMRRERDRFADDAECHRVALLDARERGDRMRGRCRRLARGWRQERTEAGKTIARLIAAIDRERAKLAEAWQATGVAGAVSGLTTLADVVATHKAGLRDSL